MPCRHRLVIGPENVSASVAAAHNGKHPVVHGLGVDADSGGPFLMNGQELFRVQGVRPARLHGEFQTFRQVKGRMELSKQPAQFFRRKGGGRSAADIDGANPVGALL